MESKEKITYPYQDPDFGFWVYESKPSGLKAARPEELRIGLFITWQAELEPLKGKWIAEKLTRHSFPAARAKAIAGEIFIKKK